MSFVVRTCNCELYDVIIKCNLLIDLFRVRWRVPSIDRNVCISTYLWCCDHPACCVLTTVCRTVCECVWQNAINPVIVTDECDFNRTVNAFQLHRAKRNCAQLCRNYNQARVVTKTRKSPLTAVSVCPLIHSQTLLRNLSARLV